MKNKITPQKKPILITGSHRSGSTWAGKSLALAPRTSYVHEPFNVTITSPIIEKQFTNWFQYICTENAEAYQPSLTKVFKYDYPLSNNLLAVRTPRMFAKTVKDQAKALLAKYKQDTPIVKDPLAVFSAEWLSETYDMNVLVMIRHPAAFCSSLKLKNWTFDFSHLLNQPLLMQRYLSDFTYLLKEYAEVEKDIIDQSILLWNCIHHTINEYRVAHPEWLFIKHEDLSSDAIKTFERIYMSFGLEFTPHAKNIILSNSGAHNPSEQQSDFGIARNSKSNIYNWKSRLSTDEINRIRAGTEGVSSAFYSSKEW